MNSIAFIGGDNRNLLISKMFEKEHTVYRYGMGEGGLDIYNCINSSKYIIAPIPFTTDNTYLHMPLNEEKIELNKFINLLSDKIIIGGKISVEYVDMMEKNGNKVFDIMKDKALVLKNTIPTAEGVVKVIIENTDITIDQSKIAVLGFGNVGKKIAETLHLLNADIYCYDINKQEVANIARCGYNVIDKMSGSISKMDVIVNTVPELILNKEALEQLDNNTLIVDVASAPGGVDFNYAKEHNYKVIHALGLPGKVAPKTSAKYVKDIIENLVK